MARMYLLMSAFHSAPWLKLISRRRSGDSESRHTCHSRRSTPRHYAYPVTIRGEMIMATSTLSQPKVVSRDEWLAARTALLAKEKAMTRALDALRAERRWLPSERLLDVFMWRRD
jgi:hypothetical protein